MKTLFLKPAPGLRVINPATGSPLPEEGMEVHAEAIWYRYLKSGDVVEVKPKKPKGGK